MKNIRTFLLFMGAVACLQGIFANKAAERAAEQRERARRDSLKRETQLRQADREKEKNQILINKYAGAVAANGGVAPKWALKSEGAKLYNNVNQQFQASINAANQNAAAQGAAAGMTPAQIAKMQADMKAQIRLDGKIGPAASNVTGAINNFQAQKEKAEAARLARMEAMERVARTPTTGEGKPKTDPLAGKSQAEIQAWAKANHLSIQETKDLMKDYKGPTASMLSADGSPYSNYTPPPAASNGQPNYFGHPAGSVNALKTDYFNRCMTEGAKCDVDFLGKKVDLIDSDSLNKIRLLQGTSVFHDNYLQDKDYRSTDSGYSAMLPAAVASFLYTKETGNAVPSMNETANRQSGPVGYQGSSTYSSDANFTALQQDVVKWTNQMDNGISALTNPAPGKDKLKVQISGVTTLLNVAGDMSKEIVKAQVQSTVDKVETKVESITNWLFPPAPAKTDKPIAVPAPAAPKPTLTATPRPPSVPRVQIVNSAPVGQEYIPTATPTAPAP